jgi:hypothetical protein
MPRHRRVVLVHWNSAEAAALIHTHRAPGFAIEHAPIAMGAMGEMRGVAWRMLRDDPPAAVLVDLSRLPSHGRQTALALRQTKSTRGLPIVFLGGAPNKVERVRAALPDAHFAEWKDLARILPRAVAAPPPGATGGARAGRAGAGGSGSSVGARPAGYSTRMLAEKLGIAAGSRVLLRGAPDGFERLLGPLPDRARLQTAARGEFDVVLLFSRSRAEFRREAPGLIARLAPKGGLWTCWPKQASKVPTDVTEDVLRAELLPLGVVDVKVCAVDSTWSGLRFARRRRAE